eukprot:TRINITY_DN663_c0_g3_i1.p1 TRINITY_DN663_c0_g3~~TRINITY_DN663_c0_g3_i1.p1  ORF type:complete len:307 (-),score=32.16 TRINITY_DN663_c0_g3_i1:110-1030(-)
MSLSSPLVNSFGQPIGYPVADVSPRPLPSHLPIVGRYCTLEPITASTVAQQAADLFDEFSSDAGDMWTYLTVGPFRSADELAAFMTHLILLPDWSSYCVKIPGSPTATATATTTAAATADDGAAPGGAGAATAGAGGATAAAAANSPVTCAATATAAVPHSRRVGMINYLRINPSCASIEVGGIAFGPSLRRSCASTEAHYLLMRYAFEELGYRRYEWKCDALNARSTGAALRLGFKHEGVFRQCLYYKGRNRDTWWGSILDSEWKETVGSGMVSWLSPSNFTTDDNVDGEGIQKKRLGELMRGID